MYLILFIDDIARYKIKLSLGLINDLHTSVPFIWLTDT